jgi:hypothetical protein
MIARQLVNLYPPLSHALLLKHDLTDRAANRRPKHRSAPTAIPHDSYDHAHYGKRKNDPKNVLDFH